MAESLSRNV